MHTGYLALTDPDWYRYLAARPNLDEVNFWQPHGGRAFRALQPGDPFIFKLRAPEEELERYAMLAAKALLEKLGWTVRHLSRTSPSDYEARRDDEVMQVDVKGTTTTGSAILLTQGEVDLHHLGQQVVVNA